ncbi:MAG: O-methyltransferase [Alphaproteobacteria bacterium]
MVFFRKKYSYFAWLDPHRPPCHDVPMAHGPIQLTPDLYTYYKSVGYREPGALAELRQHFQNHPQHHMHTLPEVAQVLSFLVQMAQPQHILEIGTFIGYSTLAMALVMPAHCHLTTCDINQDLATQAQVFWEQAGCGARIHFKEGRAHDTLHTLESQGFVADFTYIDADKAGYLDYYEWALRLAPVGGLILLDNTLSGGRVIHAHPPAHTQAIQKTNAFIHQDARVDMVMLPMGDGITLVRKRP